MFPLSTIKTKPLILPAQLVCHTDTQDLEAGMIEEIQLTKRVLTILH